MTARKLFHHVLPSVAVGVYLRSSLFGETARDNGRTNCKYVDMFIEKSATCSWKAELRVHKIIILDKINRYVNFIILKT